jgi:methylmalonyl-CoA mutase N-terminal domain/subunit
VSRKRDWLDSTYKKAAERPARFSTVSDMEIDPLYTPADVTGDYDDALGYPGEYPFTRGVYGSMYRGRPRTPTAASTSCSARVRTGSRPPSTCPR